MVPEVSDSGFFCRQEETYIHICSTFLCNIHTIDLATRKANSLQFFLFLSPGEL